MANNGETLSVVNLPIGGSKMNNTLIKNVTIITMDNEKRIIEDGVVAVVGDIIFDVGDSSLLSNYKEFEVIDGNKGILMPGMINTHTHASMIPFRSLGDDCPDRLKRFIFPLENKLVDEKLVYLGAQYGICEMLLAGVTTFCDMYYFENEVAKAAKKLGIRGVLGETIVNFPAPDSALAYGGISYSKTFIENWSNDELITPAVAPHAPYTNDDKNLIKAYELSKKYNVPLIMHVAEMDFEYKQCMEQYRKSPVQHLNDIGILDDRFIGAHMVLIDEEDINILQEKKVGVSHNIGANAKGSKGVAPIVKMYKKGMKIGLGSDGPMSGNTLDIITQMSLVGKIHKLFNKDRTLFPASEIVEMATIGGARVLNLEKSIGSIEIGKKADLVILETESVNMQPIYDYYSTIVYAANPSNVDTVMVNGKVIVKNKRLTNTDFIEIRSKVLELIAKIASIARSL